MSGQFIGLLKPADRDGNTYSETYPIEFIYLDIDNSYYRKLTQNHGSNGSCENERDIGFICLGIGKVLINSALIENSEFFDLDANPTFDFSKKHKNPLVFFKGACLDELIEDRILNTEIIIENGGVIKQYSKSKITYHQIPNTKGYPMKGASGAGLWIFVRDSNNEVIQILKGVIVEGCNTTTNAIDISYINENFLPRLKEFMNVLYQRGILKANKSSDNS